MSSLLDKFWSEPFRDAATSVYTIVAATVVVGYLLFKQTRPNWDTYDEQDYRDAGHTVQMEPMSDLALTKKQLAEYNCHNKGRRYLVALRDIIYDVSNTPEDFGPQGTYAQWSGQELSELIKAQAIAKNKNIKKQWVKWSDTLDQCFFIAGVLVDYEGFDEESQDDATPSFSLEDITDDEADPQRHDDTPWPPNKMDTSITSNN